MDTPDNYGRLIAKVDDFFTRALDRQPGAFRCGAGCSMCCRRRFSVLPVEADRIRAARDRLDPAQRQAIADRAEQPGPCPFLEDDRCAIYDSRPLICRSHGLAIKIDGRIDACPLNFTGEEPHLDGVLDLGRTNAMLVLVDHLHRQTNDPEGDGARVEMTDLAREGL